MSVSLRVLPLLTILLAVGGAYGHAAVSVASPASRPVPVVYDGDMDVDDTAALAFLCEQDKQGRIDLRAVTVDNNGFGTPGRALVHARSVLRQCGEPGIPVADGSGTVVHAAPADAMQTVETVLSGALGDGSARPVPGPETAAQLIDRTIAASPGKVTVLTTGPLSNLAQALRLWRVTHAADANWLASKIQDLYVMGGAVAVPGNLFGSALSGFDNTQEFNMWLDPASARQVFHAMRPGVTHLVPLDATNHVPVTPQYVAELGADQQTASAKLVYRIMTQPAITGGIQAGFYYWWDDLAAILAFRNTDNSVAQFSGLRIGITLTGPESGRTVRTPDGALAQAALTADQSRFEQAFRASLNGR